MKGGTFATLAIALAVSGQAALAQGAPGLSPEELARIEAQQTLLGVFESGLRLAEEARLRGDCRQRIEMLTLASSRLGMARSDGLIGQDEHDRLMQQWHAAQRQPCPPPQDATPPPASGVADGDAAGPSERAPAGQRATEPAPPSLLDRARSANLAHAQAAERCDIEEMARQLRIIEAIEEQAGEGLQTVRAAERVAGRVDSPAVQRAARDFGEIGLIREAMIRRPRSECRPWSPPRFGGFGGYRQLFIPRVGVGFSGEQQQEPAAESDRKVGMTELGGEFEFAVWSWPIRIWSRYAEGDASDSFDLPATNQAQYGAVYTAPSPSGTSGVQLQQLGMGGGTQVEVRGLSVGGEAPLTRFRTSESDPPVPVDRLFFAYTYYERLEREVRGTISSEATFFGNTFFFDQAREQALDENYFGAGLGVRVKVPLGGAFSFDLRGSAGTYYRDGELDSVERIESNVVPAADRTFTTEIADTDGDIGFEGDILFGIEHAFLPDLSLRLEATAGYRSNVGGIFNPTSSEQLLDEGRTTAIESDDAYWWGVRAGLVIPLGR